MPKQKQQNLKPKEQNLHCPFCEATSTRGTGLSAHVRARHAKQYKNWNRNPDRFVAAAKAEGAPRPEPASVLEPHREPMDLHSTESPTAQPDRANGNEALNLLQKVHDQLAARKDSIETEMARVEVLRSEHESVIAQLAAIDQAMSAFK